MPGCGRADAEAKARRRGCTGAEAAAAARTVVAVEESKTRHEGRNGGFRIYRQHGIRTRQETGRAVTVFVVGLEGCEWRVHGGHNGRGY